MTIRTDGYTMDRIVDLTATITISVDNDLSDSIDIRGLAVVGIITPSALTSTAIKFKFSIDGTNFNDLYDTSNNLVSINCAASRHIGLLAEDFVGARYLKLVTGSSESSDREITLVCRSV